MNRISKAVFLDRDGVINVDRPESVCNLSEFVFIPGSIEAIAELTRRGFTIFIITNQSAVGRGLLDSDELDRITAYMTDKIRSGGGDIAGIYFCPHRPEEGCQCRKPEPGLILQAARDHGIDLFSSVMVGDRAGDIESAGRVGCALTVLVGPEAGREMRILSEKGFTPDAVLPDLSRAADWIMSRFPDMDGD